MLLCGFEVRLNSSSFGSAIEISLSGSRTGNDLKVPVKFNEINKEGK